MDKRLLLFLIIVSLKFELTAQQLPIFTQYQDNIGYINPAALNSSYFTHEHNISIGVSHRSQWVGFEGGPQTQLLRGEYLYDQGNSFSLLMGGYIIKDKTDPMSMTGVYGRLAAVLTDDPYFGGLAIGFTVGMVQYKMDVRELAIRDEGDIAAQNYNIWYPDIGVGIYYYKRNTQEDVFYAGLSIPQVFGPDLMYESEERDFAIQRVQHFYALLGYHKRINQSSFIEASTWAKYVPNVPVNIDLNIRYQFTNALWIGTGGSTAGSIHLEAGVVLDWNVGLDNSAVRLGYGYNRYFTSYGPTNHFGAAHEINLSYSLANR